MNHWRGGQRRTRPLLMVLIMIPLENQRLMPPPWGSKWNTSRGPPPTHEWVGGCTPLWQCPFKKRGNQIESSRIPFDSRLTDFMVPHSFLLMHPWVCSLLIAQSSLPVPLVSVFHLLSPALITPLKQSAHF